MSEFRVTHDMHRRRFSRNVGVGLTLAALIVLMFALTVVKVRSLGIESLQGYDYQFRPGLAEMAE